MAENSLVLTSHDSKLIQKIWERYVEGCSLDVKHLRPEIAGSWQRCHNLNVNPRRIDTPALVDGSHLKERVRYNEQLIRIARPFMERLYDFVKGSGFQVVLSDEMGLLLEVLGDSDILSKTRSVDMCPGGDWSETSRGTNAIGTAIFERRPIQVYAFEHYCEPNQFLACSASPIFNPDGQMIGVLDLSGDYRAANPHTLGMVVASVSAIESQLRLQQATEKLYVAYRYSNTILESMSEGLISVDNQGLITEINARGGEIFGIDPKLARGRHISALMSSHAPILNLLAGSRPYEDAEVLVERLGKKIRSSASLLRDDSGRVIGAVTVFNELNRQTVRRPCLHAPRYTLDSIIGESPELARLKAWAVRAAAGNSTVLIQGESGTGKELFAQAIHNASARCNRPFVALNCAALPESLIESELFGYEEGAFTGARKGGRAGKFEFADGGTLFLDEIGDMSLTVQNKLLRVLQERSMTRVGSDTERAVDVRIIAATHKDLQAEVQAGRFRHDLYYRLHVLDVRVPPLRERKEDIPALTRYLVDRITARLNLGRFEIDEAALRRLQSYCWPGNVRELENVLERALFQTGDDKVLTEDLLDLGEVPLQGAESANEAPPEIRSLREAEAKTIRTALASCQQNIQKAAAQLGIGRNTLYRKMRQYGIS
jgi:PAS domain S-box-containing protein